MKVELSEGTLKQIESMWTVMTTLGLLSHANERLTISDYGLQMMAVGGAKVLSLLAEDLKLNPKWRARLDMLGQRLRGEAS